MIEKEKIEEVKKEVYLLFKNNANNDYQNPNWIFPHHFEVMVDLVNKMCKKYGGDLSVCILAVYLHDSGLVYRREKESPIGHEERSVEYSKKLLNEKGFSEEIINKVVDCINQTNSSDSFGSINAKIVDTADSISKFISLHYFAKASFFNNWDFFYNWARKKLDNSLKKIHFEQEKKEIMPIYSWMINAFELYGKKSKNYSLKNRGEGEKNESKKNNFTDIRKKR